MNQNNKQAPRKAPKLAGSEFKISDQDLSFEDEDDDGDGNDLASSLMEVVCLHEGGVVRFNIDGRRHKMTPGEIIKLPATYCTPVQHRPTGDPTPSVIQLLTNSKVLPIVDPRVQKNADGVPAITVKVRQARERAKAATTPQGGV